MGRAWAIVFAVFLSAPFNVSAIGVGVSPSVVEISLARGATLQSVILVSNTSDEPGLYTVSIDELSEWVVIKPNQFELTPNEEQRVMIRVTGKRSGRNATNLSIVGIPKDQRMFNAGSGVKVPFRITVEGGSRKGAVIMVSVITALVIGIFAVVFSARRKRRPVQFFKK